MNKIIFNSVILFLVFVTEITVLGQNRLLKFTSKDSINGQPKVTAWAGANMKMNGYYNIKGGLYEYETFSVASINVYENEDRQNLGVDLYQTQIRLEGIFNHEKIGSIKAHIEWDFWGGNGQMRLRKAYVMTDHWQIGQDWEVFGNQNIWANSLDFDGPPSGVWARIPFIKYFNSFGNSKWHYEIAIQAPTSDYREFPLIKQVIESDYQNVPDLVLASSYNSDWGHLRLSTIFRKINFLEDGERNSIAGYGATLSGIVGDFGQSNYQFLIFGGRGISTYIVSLVGNGYDAYPKQDDTFGATPSSGGWTSYEHYFSNTIHANLIYGWTLIDIEDIAVYETVLEDGRPLTVNNGAVNLFYNYLLANLMWDPYPKYTLGIEFNYGIKRVMTKGYYIHPDHLEDGPVELDRKKSRDAMRISFGFMYNF